MNVISIQQSSSDTKARSLLLCAIGFFAFTFVCFTGSGAPAELHSGEHLLLGSNGSSTESKFADVELLSSSSLSFFVVGDTISPGQKRLQRFHRETTRRDTSQLRQKGAEVIRYDTTRVDSSARVKYFTHRRKDSPQVEIFPRRTHPFYLNQSNVSLYNRQVFLDSTGRNVLIRETVGEKDVKTPILLPFREYVKLSYEYVKRRVWESVVRRYTFKEKKDELTQILGSVTNIDIPIPPNPILSIFGGRGINLRISGAVDIRAAFRNLQTNQITISRIGNTRNEPDFNQDVQINVNGTIGDKLNILADWNTQRTFDYENQLKIKYTGYDDEIVKSVEAGNVSLATPSSFIGSSQALFGIKAAFQVGPLKLTTIASQKKGQVRELTVTGGAQEQPIELRAYQYSTNHYFIDSVYRETFRPYYDNAVPVVRRPDLQIVDIEVWVTRLGQIDPNERDVVAFINLESRPPNGYPEDKRAVNETKPGEIEVGRFIKLRNDQYSVEPHTGVLTLNANVQSEQAIAVAYRIENGPGPNDDIFFGDFTNVVKDSSQKLILKLVKPKNLIPQFKTAWSLLLKNFYPIGGRNIKKEKFELNIYYQLPGQQPQDALLLSGKSIPLLQMFGLDKYGEGGSGGPDNKFDFLPGLTIDPTRGEIIFPNLEPFRQSIQTYFAGNGITVPPDSFVFPEVYDTTVTGARTSSKDRFIIKGKFSSEVTSTYQLGFGNLVENSVQVFLGGSQLKENVDYVVDYITGRVVIRNEAALVPGADLRIKYEQNDLFQLASKTLLGARGDYRVSERTNFGFTIMNLNQQSLSDKVRLNEEPISNTILGIDGSTSFDANVLTRAINLFPLIKTQAPSTITLKGEAAYMRPDPNTRKSPIPIDNNKGIAYIDDFEGIIRTIPLGTNYGAWHYASVPKYVPGLDPDSAHPLPDTTKMFSKAKTIWYNIIPSDVTVQDIRPKKTVAPDQSLQTVLNIEYNPTKRGEYNYSLDLNSTLFANPQNNWGGIMRLLSATANNLVDENINFIEIWMKVDQGNPKKGKMIIDLGQISEDVIPNGILDTEDKNRNGTLQPDEDTGIDGLFDAQERELHKDFIQRYPEFADDPAGDDFAYTSGSLDFSRINGTEGNGQSEIGKFPDTEDLNNNGVVDVINSYFEYEIPLDTTGGIGGQNPFIVGGNPEKGWYQFRIPLINYKRTIGNPSFSVVEFIRVWFTGFNQPILVRIADFNLVGNQWQELVRNDPTFKISAVSLEDNPEYDSEDYRALGIVRERDRTRPDANIFANEQSMALIYNNLKDGDSRQAIKYYSIRPLDVFNYRTMKMFVHGDVTPDHGLPPPTTNGQFDSTRVTVALFMQFGLDSLNYYEYREPVWPGWHPNNNVAIEFSELTAVKQLRDSTGVSMRVPVKNGPPGATFFVRGNPTLTQIRQISIGVENPLGGATTIPITGQVWVNELRLSEVDDSPGFAYRFDAGIKLADIGTLGFNISRVGPTFHTLEQRFGVRSAGVSWGFGANFGLERLFPESWAGTSIPVSYTHSEGIIKPKYLPGTDVLVEEAAVRRQEAVIAQGATPEQGKSAGDSLRVVAQSVRVADTWALPTVKIALPTDKWFIRDTFNKLTLGFNYNTTRERDPVIETRQSWAWTARLGYGINFSPDYYIAPFTKLFDGVFLLDEYKNMKIYFTPSNFSFGVGAARTQTREKIRNQAAEKPVLRDFTTNRSLAFGWKFIDGGLLNLSSDYALDVSSSLVHLETDAQGRQRSFSDILSDIFFKDKFINFGITNNYNQRVTFTPRPRLPNVLEINRYFDLGMGYSSAYRWTNNLQQGQLGKTAAFTANFNFTTNFRLKQLTDPWFASKGENVVPPPQPERLAVSDSTQKDTARVERRKIQLPSLSDIVKYLVKIPFLDFENVNVTYNLTNSVQNTGVRGETGFSNFWRFPFLSNDDVERGPSRFYQLGLVGDPSASISQIGFKGTFPFFGVKMERGLRAPGGNLIDNFSQTNKLGLKTSRGLWEGARIDLSWSVGWSFNKNQSLISDSTGRVTVFSTLTTGDVERSYFTLPVSFLNSDISTVAKKFNNLRSDPTDLRPDEEKLAQAFEEGFESLPFLKKVLGRFVPRANWSIHWDGLERLPIFKNIATRVSLDHAYSSAFNRRWRGNLGGGEITESERVTYGFIPLVGLNFTFQELLKGNFGASARFATNTSYDLNTSSRNIVETFSKEISLNVNYSRRGFEFPLFGLSLQNDIDISLAYSFSRNARKTFDVSDLTAEGIPLEGSNRTTIEPRIRYVLSNRVNAALFYRYIKVEPDAFGSRIPGTTTNEAGLDIHIAIQ